MFLAQLIGSLAVKKHGDSFDSHTLVIVRPIKIEESDPSNLHSGSNTLVAVDTVGASRGDVVLLAQGISAGKTLGADAGPADTFVVATVDVLTVGGCIVYRSPKIKHTSEIDTINGRANGHPDSALMARTGSENMIAVQDCSSVRGVTSSATRRRTQPKS